MYKEMKLTGNVAKEGAFSGIVYRLDKVKNIAEIKKEKLPENPVFVYDNKLTVGEVDFLPGPCAVLTAGGGNTSEEYNYVSAGGKWDEIIVFANGVIGDLNYLHDYMKVTVSLKENGEISIYENIPDIVPKEGLVILSPDKDIFVRDDILRSLNQINEKLNIETNKDEIEILAEKLKIMSNTTSVEERYRIGELLAKAIHLNNSCIHVLNEMSKSNERFIRFTAARCMSKLVEKHPELIPSDSFLFMANLDINDRTIPKLLIRTLGKGKNHPNIQFIIQKLTKESKYKDFLEKVLNFIPDVKKEYY